MKILKPGKVEQRKFVCVHCGCVFVADESDLHFTYTEAKTKCPCCWLEQKWMRGEPYEEPTQDLEADRERLRRLVQEWNTNYFGGVNAATEFLLDNGVTFREGVGGFNGN